MNRKIALLPLLRMIVPGVMADSTLRVDRNEWFPPVARSEPWCHDQPFVSGIMSCMDWRGRKGTVKLHRKPRLLPHALNGLPCFSCGFIAHLLISCALSACGIIHLLLLHPPSGLARPLCGIVGDHLLLLSAPHGFVSPCGVIDHLLLLSALRRVLRCARSRRLHLL